MSSQPLDGQTQNKRGEMDEQSPTPWGRPLILKAGAPTSVPLSKPESIKGLSRNTQAKSCVTPQCHVLFHESQEQAAAINAVTTQRKSRMQDQKHGKL